MQELQELYKVVLRDFPFSCALFDLFGLVIE